MKKLQTGHIDWIILLSAAGLMLFSVAFVYSASASFADVRFGSSEKLFWSHGIRVLFGLLVTILFAKIDYHVWQRYSKTILVVAVGFLLYVLAAGTTIKGATRWVDIGFINFQPSELAKFALVIHLAAMLTERQEYIKNFRYGFLPMLLWICIVCGLIALQPNLSTASVIFLISMLVIFIGNANILHLLGIGSLGFAAAVAYGLSAQYRLNRLMAFFGVEGNRTADAVNYQLDQALLAFGSGGLFGVGPGQSRQRDWFLPESYGDFIFSIVGEEYGYIGVLLILGAFCVILWRGFVTARRAPDDFGRFLAAGITFTVGIYTFINAGVTCGLLPTTGLPMPFISYGGTAILFSAAALGILLNISAQAGVYPRKQGLQSPFSFVPSRK
jgi:cell division protein FtsW